MSDSFGRIFRITSFGESHGPAVGIVIEGCPAGMPIKEEEIQDEVDKRKPAVNAGQTARQEPDRVEVLSGVFEGHTTGAPIALLVRNSDTISADYEKMRFLPRPGHADYTAFMKYGGLNDYRGGGRFSGRITVGLVMAGAVAKKLIGYAGIEVLAHTVQIGSIKANIREAKAIRENVYRSPLRCADAQAEKAMAEQIEEARGVGDSLGGVIEGLALNLPVGLGEPYFDTLEGELAKAILAIPAVKGIEFGAGFSAAEKRGSQYNDPMIFQDDRVTMESNNAGGVLGGISNGMPLLVRTVVKPTPSISRPQMTVDLQARESKELRIEGRHDVCLVPRAVIVVESMMAVTLCDLALRAGLIERILK